MTGLHDSLHVDAVRGLDPDMPVVMVNLVKLSGTRLVHGENKEDTEEDVKLEGPPVPGVSDAGVVSGQDEVDDLLSSLGF